MGNSYTSTTDPQDELFPVVNEQDEVIGKISRQEAHRRPDVIHRAVGIFIYDRQGDILIQKRSAAKDTYPNCWEIVGGHVAYGDGYFDTMLREATEELGLQIEPDELTLVGKLLIRLPKENEYWELYRYVLAGQAINFSSDEISETRFVSLPELKRMLQDPDCQWSDKARQQFKTLLNIY